jgi:hypothetical protein
VGIEIRGWKQKGNKEDKGKLSALVLGVVETEIKKTRTVGYATTNRFYQQKNQRTVGMLQRTMLQRTVFINKIRMLQRTQMLQPARRSTIGQPARPRTQHDCHHDMKVKPEAATAVTELLMMGGNTPETC